MTHRTAGTYHPPTADQYTADLDRRTRQLEQRPQPGPPVPRFGITIGNPAPVVADDDIRHTGRWWPWRGAVDLEYLTVDAQNVDAATTLKIRRAGVDVIVVDVAEGRTPLGVDERWTPADYLDATIEGQVGIVLVQLWFRGEGFGHLNFVVPSGDET